jgi:hypothetical protein
VTVIIGFFFELEVALLTVADTGVNAGGDGTGPPTTGVVGTGVAVTGVDVPIPISIEVRESKSSNRS